MTRSEIQSGIRVLLAVSEAIRDAGEIPSGHLYAALSSRGCSQNQFDQIVRTLCLGDPPLVRKRGDVLVWNGDEVVRESRPVVS